MDDTVRRLLRGLPDEQFPAIYAARFDDVLARLASERQATREASLPQPDAAESPHIGAVPQPDAQPAFVVAPRRRPRGRRQEYRP